ncbi:hypothetical protein TSMEX_004776, partial [Taenia solium]
VLIQEKLSELATYLERELDSKPRSELHRDSAKKYALNQRPPVSSKGDKSIEGVSVHRSSTERKIKRLPGNLVSANESMRQSLAPVAPACATNLNTIHGRVVEAFTNTDFPETSDATCQVNFLNMEREFDLLKIRNLELSERCRALENELCHTIDENHRLAADVAAHKSLLSVREDVELRLAEFIKDLDHLKGEQEHLIEEVMHAFTEKIKIKSTQIKNLQTELQLAKEKVKEDIIEKTLLENQSVVIDDLTAEAESLRTTNTDLDNELKRVNFTHSEEMRRLRDKMATMERDFTERINCLERQVDEGRETEKFNACFKDIAQVVEDLKTVKLNMESQQNFFKETVTQMQSRQEDVLRQMEDNYQNSTKDLFKMIQEEDQRMQRLREELGLCDDLENRWRERIKDSLLGGVDESVLTAGIRCQLEETITALHATHLMREKPQARFTTHTIYVFHQGQNAKEAINDTGEGEYEAPSTLAKARREIQYAKQKPPPQRVRRL